MRSLISTTLATVLALFFSGCLMHEKNVLSINKDGSGTLVSTHYISNRNEKGEKTGQERTQAQAESDAKDEAKLYGDGVTLKSAELLKDKPDMYGEKITYAIADVSKLAFPLFQQLTVENIHFEFVKGPSAKLTVKMPILFLVPDANKTLDAKDEAKERAALGEEISEFEIVVDGVITKTNTKFMNEKKNGAVLFREDLAALVKDDAAWKKFSTWKKTPREAALDEDLKKYIQIDVDQTVTIEFH